MTEEYGKVHCPGCGEPVPLVNTAYGQRIVCAEEGRRWTRLRTSPRVDRMPKIGELIKPIGEYEEWVEEAYSHMRENTSG